MGDSTRDPSFRNPSEASEKQPPAEASEIKNLAKTPPAKTASWKKPWKEPWKNLVGLWRGTAEKVTERLPADIDQLRKAYDSAQSNAQALSQNISQNISQALPQNMSQNISQGILGAFSVSDDKIADILQQVRAELPTTEALLIGKPQAGKSSIVRGLTGVSADIIGQGFRPHTQNTERYAYPSEDLPLLIFTDTVGLGDIGQETEGIVTELTDELKKESGCARILILTVKITDFAVDQLRLIVQQIRKTYPDVPCLLAVTCLHELYPSELENHPNYPPGNPADENHKAHPGSETISRAFNALTDSLQDCFDQAVLLDFTREEDGFTPVFYGQEALRDALAELLPTAEANAIYQLIDDQAMASTQLGSLYRDVGRRYISAFAVIAATLAAVPLPFATMPVLTALQVSMVGLLGKLYGQTITRSQAGGVVSAIAGGFFAQAIGRELIKFIPGFGSVIAASWAAGYTWALGEGACAYFGDLMGGKKPDPDRIQQVMANAFDAAKERFRTSAKNQTTQPEQANKPEKTTKPEQTTQPNKTTTE